MAVYWGQGPNQQRLAHFCADSNIDIIPIAFLNVFPDQVGGGYPGTNFGNQCGDETFKNKDGSDSPLLSNCPLIGPDIKTCQALGKKILLSLGGAIPTDQSINDDESAVAFARFLWNAFGPEDATYDGPRPFGDAVVDGFDFDIESAVSDNDPASQYRGYGTMIDTLRDLFAADTQNEYYISGSPQCVIPDAHLAQPIETSWFDFLFIQFYNTPQCSARAYFDASYGRVGGKPSSISFDAWVGFVRTTAKNKNVKLYIGLPAAPLTALAYDTYMYIAPDDVINLIDLFQCRYPKEFGGIMVFDATYSEQNLIENKPFVDVVKGQLMDSKCAMPAISSTIISSSSSSTIPTGITSLSTSLPANSTVTHNSTYTAGPTVPIGTGSASNPSYNSNGIWNGTSSSTAVFGTGASSISPYPTSTGIWNTTTIIETGSSFIPPYPTSTGIWNGTSSTTTIIGTGSSFIPPHPTSTGIWNTTTVIGTGSSSIPPYPTSTGIWNGTLSSTTVIGTGSSSIPPYPTNTSIWNATSSPTTIIASGTFSNPPYPTSVGIWNGTTSSVPSGTGYNSSSAPVHSTSTSNFSSTSNSVASSSSTSATITLHPSGGSSGSSSSIIPTSSPYLIDNSPSSSGMPASGGVIYTTATITVTQCPPEVTNCPVRTSVTVYPVTSSSRIPITSVPTKSPETTSSVPSHGGLTTLIVTSYVTTCPVTNIITTGGSTSIETTFTVSTVTSTITSVVSSTATSARTLTASSVPDSISIPTEHESTPLVPIPSPDHGELPNPVSPPSGSGNSPAGGSASQPAPQTEQPAHVGSSIPTHGGPSNPGSPSSGGNANSPVGGGNSPASPDGDFENPGLSSSGGNANNPVGGGNSPASPDGDFKNPGSSTSAGNANILVGGGNSPASPSSGSAVPTSSLSGSNANSPVGGGNSPVPSNGEGENPYSAPSSVSGNSPAQSEQPARGPSVPGSGTPSSSENTSNSPFLGAGNSPQPGNPSGEDQTTNQETSSRFLTSTVPANPAISGAGSSSGTAPLPVIITQTLVPVPLSPEQTALPTGPASEGLRGASPVQASPVPSSAPFPVGNGTAIAGGPSGSSISAPSASGTGAFSPGNVTPFTGDASKMKGSSIVALAVIIVGILFM
ncbi:MAG: hypothetical protein Q9172_004233 [Xanthocarpia lactea]